MSTAATKRRTRVLIKPAVTVARILRDQPNTWHLIAVGELEHARVMAQTAHRINKNYRPDKNGRIQGLKAFAADETGYFKAVSSASQSRARPVAPVEMHGQFVLDGGWFYHNGEPRVP